MAESAVEVDILSNGRFDLGVGQGYVRAEFAGFGIPRRERAGPLTGGLEAIRGMWTQDPFSYKGTYYDLADVSLHPKPVQDPHPPIWVGATAPPSVARVGRMGFHYLGLGDPKLQAVYDGALQEAGHDPADFASAHIRTVYARWIELAADFDTALTGITNVPEPSQIRHTANPLLGAPLIGTPAVVAAGLQEMLASIRTTHLVLGMHLPGLDPARTRRSMELFAREVMPALR